MIITEKHAKKLIRDSKAKSEGRTYDDGKTYEVVTRFDQQRTDHYFVGDGDLRNNQ